MKLTTPFSLERLRPSKDYRKQGWDLHFEFLPEGFQFLSGQNAEKRFQYNRRLPHARVQVVPKHFEIPPGPAREHRRSTRNILHDSAGFLLQFFDDFLERMQLVEESRPAAKKYLREKIFHGRDSL